MKENKGKYDPLEVLHEKILECFHEHRENMEAKDIVMLNGSKLSEIIAEAKIRATVDHASKLIDTDLEKILLQGKRIRRIKELEEENDKLKVENEKLKNTINRVKAYTENHPDFWDIFNFTKNQ